MLLLKIAIRMRSTLSQSEGGTVRQWDSERGGGSKEKNHNKCLTKVNKLFASPDFICMKLYFIVVLWHFMAFY